MNCKCNGGNCSGARVLSVVVVVVLLIIGQECGRLVVIVT